MMHRVPFPTLASALAAARDALDRAADAAERGDLAAQRAHLATAHLAAAAAHGHAMIHPLPGPDGIKMLGGCADLHRAVRDMREAAR
jgi:hypothetical protein